MDRLGNEGLAIADGALRCRGTTSDIAISRLSTSFAITPAGTQGWSPGVLQCLCKSISTLVCTKDAAPTSFINIWPKITTRMAMAPPTIHGSANGYFSAQNGELKTPPKRAGRARNPPSGRPTADLSLFGGQRAGRRTEDLSRPVR